MQFKEYRVVSKLTFAAFIYYQSAVGECRIATKTHEWGEIKLENDA